MRVSNDSIFSEFFKITLTPAEIDILSLVVVIARKAEWKAFEEKMIISSTAVPIWPYKSWMR